MANGYLERGYGTHGEIDPDRGDRRELGERDWQERDQGWRQGNRERAFFEDDDRGWRGQRHRWPERDQGESSDSQSWDWSGNEGHIASPDDHYRSWRDRHLSELDRDYRDYCREREAQFHRDFDDWRRQKYANPQPLSTGMTQTGLSHDPTGMTQAEEDSAADTPRKPDPTATATLDTSSGRGRSRN